VNELSTPLPDEELIFLVNGHRDRSAFEISRLATVQNICALLDEASIDHREFRKILDFGCGCGRILAGWEPFLRTDLKLYGVDINERLVDFCQKNIPFADASVSRYLPPLKQFARGQLDFVYAASVFTHLNARSARAWAREFRRIVRPGGVLMMSFHGAWYAPELERISRFGPRTLNRKGFYVFLHGKAQETWKGSNSYATFMTPEFAEKLFRGFELIKTFPGTIRGPNPFASYQDISIFRRKPSNLFDWLV
jgi:SAM-dependent methyltransferase